MVFNIILAAVGVILAGVAVWLFATKTRGKAWVIGVITTLTLAICFM